VPPRLRVDGFNDCVSLQGRPANLLSVNHNLRYPGEGYFTAPGCSHTLEGWVEDVGRGLAWTEYPKSAPLIPPKSQLPGRHIIVRVCGQDPGLKGLHATEKVPHVPDLLHRSVEHNINFRFNIKPNWDSELISLVQAFQVSLPSAEYCSKSDQFLRLVEVDPEGTPRGLRPGEVT